MSSRRHSISWSSSRLRNARAVTRGSSGRFWCGAVLWDSSTFYQHAESLHSSETTFVWRTHPPSRQPFLKPSVVAFTMAVRGDDACMAGQKFAFTKGLFVGFSCMSNSKNPMAWYEEKSTVQSSTYVWQPTFGCQSAEHVAVKNLLIVTASSRHLMPLMCFASWRWRPFRDCIGEHAQCGLVPSIVKRGGEPFLAILRWASNLNVSQWKKTVWCCCLEPLFKATLCSLAKNTRTMDVAN